MLPRMLPSELGGEIKSPQWRGRPRGLFEDFEQGDVILHSIGHTIGESEHMQLTILTRNSHPLHFDEVYCRERSFTKTRVVEGGLVFAWTASLASRDTTANALWEVGYDKESHRIQCWPATRCTRLRGWSRNGSTATAPASGSVRAGRSQERNAGMFE